ncbi:MAG: efflux RND transporter periplasmic adaptor subunit [Candidatus Gracilibacteria bacterium]
MINSSQKQLILLWIFVSVFLTSCGNTDSAQTKEKTPIEVSVMKPMTGGVSLDQTIVGRVIGDPEVTISSQSAGILSSVSYRIGENVTLGSSLATIDTSSTTNNLNLNNAQTALNNASSIAESTIASLESDLSAAHIQYENAKQSQKSVYNTTQTQLDLGVLTAQNNTAQAKTNLEQAELALSNFQKTKQESLSSLNDRASTLSKTIDASLIQVVSTLEPALESADKILGVTDKNKDLNDSYEPYLGSKLTRSKEQANDAFLTANQLLDSYRRTFASDPEYRLSAAREANSAAVELYRLLTLVVQNSVIDVNRFSQTQSDSILSQVSVRQQALIPLESTLTSLQNSQKDLETQRSTTRANLETQELSLKKALEIAQKQNGLIAGSDTVATAELSEKNLENTKAQINQARESADNALKLADANLKSLEAKIAAQRTQAQANVDNAKGQRDIANVSVKNGNFLSPVNGVVTARLVEPGMSVSPGTPLFTLATNSTKIVRSDLPLNIAEALKVGDEVSLVSLSSSISFSGRINRIASAPDANTKLYRIDIALPNDTDLHYGEFVQVHAQIIHGLSDTQSGSISLPMKVIMAKSQGRYEVWVIEDSRLAKREVTLGAISSNQAEVLSGITSDTMVVTSDGIYGEGDSVIIR